MIRFAHARSVRLWFASAMALVVVAAMATMGGLAARPAAAAQATVDLGTATPFSVLAGSAVTNTGSSVLAGGLGVFPGSSITGFPPGSATFTDDDNAAAGLAQSDLTTAYNFAAGATPTNNINYSTVGGDTLGPGVYNASSSMGLTGTVTLSGAGVYIFQAGSTLITATDSTVALLDGALPGCVFWQVGSSATLGSGTTFAGTIMALTSVTLVTGANVAGRVLAQNGAVTLDDNDITVPTACSTPVTGGAASTTTTGVIDDATGSPPTGTEVTGASFHDTATVVGASVTPTGTVTYSYFTNGTCLGTPASIQTVSISLSGSVPDSTSTGPLGPGSYSFDATYSGDTTYASGTSSCEPFSVLAPVIPPPVIPPPVIPPPVTPPVPTVTTPVTPPVPAVTPPVTPPVPAVTPPVTTATTPPVTATAAAGPSATGATSGTGSPSGTSTAATTASPNVVLPTGAPETGLGGAARSGDNVLLVALGAAALFGAVAATGLALRRRRVLVVPGDTDLDEE